MSLTKESALAVLATVAYPGFTRDIVSFGAVKDLEVGDGAVRFRLDLGPGNPAVAPRIAADARAALEKAGARSVTIRLGGETGPPAGLAMAGPPAASRPAAPPEPELLPEVRHVVAVASGKGGVGKSTVAVNLAVALAARGLRTGLLDADIYGPSIPLMLRTDERPSIDPAVRRIRPFERHGVRFMSLGFLVDKDEAVIWRGPMVMKAISELLANVDWGALDVLVVDLPPGTGDAQLTLSQKVRLAGAVIVTTPQDVALADAIKGVAMFRKVGVPILGLVENMSFFHCPECGHRAEIFGYGGGRKEAARLEVPFLGEIPLDPAVRDCGDRGTPLAAADPSAGPSRAFAEIATRVAATLAGDGGEDAPGPGGFLSRVFRGFGGPQPAK